MSTPNWAGCAVPEDLVYDVGFDVWVRTDEDHVTVGMTDVAQTRCGRLVAVSWKAAGRRVRRGRPLCVVESSKWVGPVLSPLTGTIAATNEDGFSRDIAVANRDPYGEGWLVRLRPEDMAGEAPQLTGAEAAFAHYRRVIDEQGIRCFRCAE